MIIFIPNYLYLKERKIQAFNSFLSMNLSLFKSIFVNKIPKRRFDSCVGSLSNSSASFTLPARNKIYLLLEL